jgi:putative ABC transport system substrate-binding protein
MNRRAFLGNLAGGLLAAPFAAEAQRSTKGALIGVLSSQSRGDPPGSLALPAGLQELGYQEGRDVVIEWRGAAGHADRFPALAGELVRLDVDVMVATVDPAIQAARTATKAIPIVMVTPSDPVGLGFVRSLARPGGNVTGLTWQTREAVPKRLEILKETVPRLSQVAVLWDPTEPERRRQVEEAHGAAPKLGLQLHVVEVRSVAELEGAFASMVRARAGALLVEASTMLSNSRAHVADLAAKNGLATMGWYGGLVDAGFLMSYSPSAGDQYRRAAYFVVRILRGAKPADLPVEQPTKFELAVNLKTAKALGLTLPASLLLRADQVID